MPHRDYDDARRLRIDDLRERIGVDDAPDPGQAAALVQATGTPTVGQFFAGDRVTLTGELTEGGAATVAVSSTSSRLIYLHGVEGDPRLTGPVNAGDVIGADLFPYRWGAWRPPPPNPHNCWGCVWPTTEPFASLMGMTTLDGIHYTSCQTQAGACFPGAYVLAGYADGDPRQPVTGQFQLFAILNGDCTNSTIDSVISDSVCLPYNADAGTVAGAINGCLAGVGFAGTVTASGGPLPGTPITIQMVGDAWCGNAPVLCMVPFSFDAPCGFMQDTVGDPTVYTITQVQASSTCPSFPYYADLDLSTCTLTISAFVTFTDGVCRGAAAGYTCDDLPSGTPHPGDSLAAFQFALTSRTCTPLRLTFDTSAGTTNGNTACFDVTFCVGPYNPPPVFTYTGDDLPGPFAWARCLGTRGNLSTQFTLSDPFGMGGATLTYDPAWALPCHGTGRRPGWWGCGTISVPDQCAGSGTITVPVVYFLDQLTCGFLLYYKAAHLNGLGVPDDGCANKLAPRAGTCSGGDGAGQSFGIDGALATTALPVIGPSVLPPTVVGAGATWITVDSFDPLHISVVLDKFASLALYGTFAPQTLTITG